MDFICKECGREFEKQGGLNIHMKKIHGQEDQAPPTAPPNSPNSPNLDELTQQITKSVQENVNAQLKAMLESVQKAQVEIAEAVNTRLTETQTQIQEQINAKVNEIGEAIATQAQQEIEKRVGNNTGGGDKVNALATLAAALRGGGGGGFDMSAFQNMGNMLAALLGPVVNIWSAGVTTGLQSVGFAQRMTSGKLSPEEVATQLTEATAKSMGGIIPKTGEAKTG